MNIVKKLTLRHLKENKGRTIITTLGICVSVAMITAVFVSIASFMLFYGDASIFESGNKHAEFYYLNQEQLKTLKEDERIDKIGLSANLPFESDGFMLPGSTGNAAKGNFYAGDETNLQQMLTCQMDGELPKDNTEIAVEQSFIEKNKLDWKIGDTVTLQLGERYYEYDYEDENGEMLHEKSHIYGVNGVSYEEFIPANEAQFKIVGILHNNSPTMIRTKIIRGLSAEELAADINAAITLKTVNTKSLDEIKDIAEKLGVDTKSQDMWRVNKDYLQSKFSIDEDSLIATSLIPMGLIVLIIIMIASVVLIYNSFGMSLSERTRYLGMLGSVGATKRQKKQSVYFEGAFLGIIGIPLGIVGGIIGIGITLKLVGSKIIETGMLMGIEDSSIEFKAVVPFWTIVGIVIFSLITIFISAVIPAKKASAITPVEALRQSTEIKVKAKNVRTPKYIRKIFGYEGELAHKNLKRNGRKSRVITASIAISVILFITVNSFCALFTRVNGDMDVPYQIQINLKADASKTVADDLKDMDNVDDVYTVNSQQCEVGGHIDNDYENPIAVDDSLTNTYKGLWEKQKTIMILGIDDDRFNKLCEDNGIDSSQYYHPTSTSCNVLMLNNLSREKGGAGVFSKNAIGKNIYYLQNEDDECCFTIKDLIDYKSDEKLFSLVPKSYFAAYVPASTMFAFDNKIFEDDDYNTTQWSNLVVETDNHKDTEEKIQTYVEENSIEAHVYNMAASMESMNTLLFVLQVFVYGFITLITLITVANIINTISTSIALRRKEFAMLKSVGTTQKGFYKMICLESLFYGLNALIFSIPISVLISFALNRLLGKNDVPFEIDFVLYLCVILAVFLIIGFAMFYSIQKIKKDSIIETLKQDIT